MSEKSYVHYDSTGPALVIRTLIITDPAVVQEARHWSTGRRDTAVNDAELESADLTSFTIQALQVGARAIATAGGVQDTHNLEALIEDLGTRTTAATSSAAAATVDVVHKTTAALDKASSQATKAIVDAGAQARKSFNTDIESARNVLAGELSRLFGGENPELLARLTPALDKFSVSLNQRVADQTTEMISKATRLFDPADPTSPMAKHTAELNKQHAALSAAVDQNHKLLGTKVDELTKAIQVTRAAADAAAFATCRTPLKGESYAQGVHRILEDVAAGLGDEYADTSSLSGTIPRCKKGDGVLTIDGGGAAVVVEMSDSSRTVWNAYLDESERNRDAQASLGLVRTPGQLKGKHIQCITGRRIVMAFDPATDDPELLRTVIQLLRISAQAAAVRQDTDEIQTAVEKVDEAIALLSRIDSIKKNAESIKKTAVKIETETDGVRDDLARLLAQAQTALRGAGADVAPASQAA